MTDTTTTATTAAAVAEMVAYRRRQTDWSAHHEVLAAQALRLAEMLDAADAPRSAAEASRELRQVVASLRMSDEYASRLGLDELLRDINDGAARIEAEQAAAVRVAEADALVARMAKKARS